MNISLRDRISNLTIYNRLAISFELLFVCGLHALEINDFPAILFSFPLGWISLWLRKLGWRGVGLRRPTSWLRTLGLGVLIGVMVQLFEIWLVEPLMALLGGGTIDLSQYENLPGSIPNLIAWIIIGWLLGAFLEELVFRGYMINRFADLFGNIRTGWTVGILVSSMLFAIGHMNLGVTSVIENFIFALIFAGVYLKAQHNLWLTIIAHGIYNSLAFVLIYLGLYP